MKQAGYLLCDRTCFSVVLFMGIIMPSMAFADMPMQITLSFPAILLLFIVLLLLLGAVFIVSHWRQEAANHKQHQRSLKMLPARLLAGYYSYDIKTGTETFSEGLKTTLNLPASVCRFEQLKDYFLPHCYEKLKNLCESSLYSFDENTDPIIIPFSPAPAAEDKWFECTLTISDNMNNRDETVTIWFRDISGRITMQQKISTENESLKGTVQQLLALLDSITFPVWCRNQTLQIEYGNAAYKKMVGFKEGNTILPGIPGLEEHMLSLATLSQKTGQLQHINKHVVLEGARRLFQFSEIPLIGKEGLIGIGYDITRQEDIEKELKFHISAQAALLESSSSAMAIYGADTHLKFFNQAFMKLWGLDEAWLASQPPYGLVLDVLREKRKLPEQISFLNFKQGHLKLFTDITETYNEFFHLPDGRSIRMIAIPHALGGVLFAYEDMTDRLALESSYNMLAAVQRATLDNLHEGIAVIGQDGRLKLFNPVYAQMWYHDMEMLKTKPHFSDLVETAKFLYKYDGSWDAVKQRVLSMLSNRVILREQVERMDGKVIDRLCVPLPDGATLMSYLDVTDSSCVERSLRERNEALQEVDHIKTEFLANVSYELRSPLTSIMGLSEALGKHYLGALNPRQTEYVEGIYASSQQLLSIINDILDLTSMEAGNMELEVERFNVYVALSSVLSLMKERIKEKGIIFNFECEESIGTMVGDERCIKQVALKLLSNAIEFTPVGGKVILGVKEEKDALIIWIEDTGEGIDSGDHQAVFNKFYRTESAKVKGKGGAGLGLSVVKRFIELHGGTIMLESSLAVGTTIRCILPRNNTLLLPPEHKKDVVICTEV